jgi:hypothetical protein
MAAVRMRSWVGVARGEVVRVEDPDCITVSGLCAPPRACAP